MLQLTQAMASGVLRGEEDVYKRQDWGRGTEAFAEMTSATMACPESLETIKKYLPKSYALYDEMLEVIANQI